MIRVRCVFVILREITTPRIAHTLVICIGQLETKLRAEPALNLKLAVTPRDPHRGWIDLVSFKRAAAIAVSDSQSPKQRNFGASSETNAARRWPRTSLGNLTPDLTPTA